MQRAQTFVLGLVVSLAGCNENMSAAQRCRMGNAFGQSGRALAGQTSYTANAVENLRCDVIEANERAEAREARREARARRAQQEAHEQAELAAVYAQRRYLASLRQNPKYPELGATSREAKTICDGERGQWVVKGDDVVGCRIGGVSVFACVVDNGQTVKCTHWREGAEIPDERDTLITELGQPESQSVADGFRVYTWRSGAVMLTGYDKGVIITLSKAATP